MKDNKIYQTAVLDLYEAVGEIDEKYIDEAGEAVEDAGDTVVSGAVAKAERKHRYKRIGSIAACLICIIGITSAGAWGFLTGRNDINGEYSQENMDYSLMKNGSFDYLFPDENGNSGEASKSDASLSENMDMAMCPFAFSRYFEEQRGELENSGRIPVLDDYSEFTCVGNYNKDGSIYDVEMSWSIYAPKDSDTENGISGYRHISLMAAAEEVPDVSDCVAVGLDEYGQPIPTISKTTTIGGADITVTQESGGGYSIILQDKNSWYKLCGSRDVSRLELGKALSWLWTNGVDFDYFKSDNGDIMDYESFTCEALGIDPLTDDTSEIEAKIPATFAACVPDTSALGWILDSGTVSTRNGEPRELECHYIYDGKGRYSYWNVTHVNNAVIAQKLDYSCERGDSTFLGDISDISSGDLTKDDVAAVVTGEKGISVSFTIGRAADSSNISGNSGSTDDSAAVKSDSDTDSDTDYYFISLSTGYLTADQVWTAIQSVYGQWR